MRNEDSSPGQGRRSLQLWSRLAAARRALEARGESTSLEEALREAGLDAGLLHVLRTELASPTPMPPPQAPAADPEEDGPIVRSNGRVALRIL